MSDDRRAFAIAQYVLGILQKFNCVEKLVAQTYDGASVMSFELNGVQAKIKENVLEAMFLHCYAHKLNLVLFPANNAMQDPCGPCEGCPYGNRTDLAAAAVVAPHGLTARVESSFHFLVVIKN